MKSITLTFLTPKGEEAYHMVGVAGVGAKFKERMVIKKVFNDHKISDDPLTIRIDIKIPRLAVQVNFDQAIEEALKSKGAIKGKDYTMVLK